jgi:hypothetical protein
MVPSLKGIRGLAYVVVGPEDGGPKLDKLVRNKLDQLKLPISPMRSLKPGFKPMDAILEIKVIKSPDSHLSVHLSVTQWCTLLRAPEIKVKAVTYSDNLSARPGNLNEVIADLTSQFVINFLKANKSK